MNISGEMSDVHIVSCVRKKARATYVTVFHKERFLLFGRDLFGQREKEPERGCLTAKAWQPELMLHAADVLCKCLMFSQWTEFLLRMLGYTRSSSYNAAGHSFLCHISFTKTVCEPFLLERAGLPLSTWDYLLIPHLNCVYQTLQNAVAQEGWSDLDW